MAKETAVFYKVSWTEKYGEVSTELFKNIEEARESFLKIKAENRNNIVGKVIKETIIDDEIETL